MYQHTAEPFYFVDAGPVGEKAVLEALLGRPVEVEHVVLEGFEVQKQLRPPGVLRDVIETAWKEQGQTYPGAYTLVPNADGQAIVGRVKFNTLGEFQKAAKLLNDWSGHQEGWFVWQQVEGYKNTYTEMLHPDHASELVPAPFDYRLDPVYKEAVKSMAEQAASYRISKEGTGHNGPEKK